ncbi:MAG: tryptophan synthase subunit alpha [Kordiimonas sp.]|nr:tryptophan synthase subunit alpha [Kordiimonas sp.]|tara:strand:+ start:722 stop:1579 length:858 start_codon:yes stop_codon:yes gene_type:complete
MTAPIKSQRLAARFSALKEQQRAALVTFVTAGDPDPDNSQRILDGLPAAGADIIELGMPFSDPMADGPAIQAASLRALQGGMTLRRTLDMVRQFRKKDTETPIILMGYYNPIYIYGVEVFLKDALAAGADGLIIVDLPPEEDPELAIPALSAGMDFIHLATPTSDDKRLEDILRHASGFLYYVSIAGITGTQSAQTADVEQALSRIRRQTNLPLAVGFGIKTPADVASFAHFSDAVVVGSALINVITENLDSQGNPRPCLVEKLHEFVAQLATGVHKSSSVTSSG